jgi:hypothetical protein
MHGHLSPLVLDVLSQLRRVARTKTISIACRPSQAIDDANYGFQIVGRKVVPQGIVGNLRA